jgi:UDPglucose 6-dehydrogenase
MKQICVIGVGYVGVVTGACFADLGNHVIALDINEQRVANLKKGIMPIYEPGLEELVKRNVKAGRLQFTTDYAEAVKGTEFAFIAVGTPSGVNGEADLQYVAAAAKSIAENMTAPIIIINKSTVPVGTGDWVADIVKRSQKKPIDFAVVSCPCVKARPLPISWVRTVQCSARLTRTPPTKWRNCTWPCAPRLSSPTCAPPK